ncbi:hypothetical protein A8F94_08985 [Bacillus sp. FJAT-27225]|uniref:hypothetical protein n=1 Tax=Bacillus sp. FJAT-27225 TaxID=1743144 RepID=UPI00080C353F|nr:hypothetical protein [Bacillus sp. FJAT-27225]OCA87952.1 hypothetical protein A8F94_08985 [Bacillus sp. FJAT-27225]
MENKAKPEKMTKQLRVASNVLGVIGVAVYVFVTINYGTYSKYRSIAMLLFMAALTCSCYSAFLQNKVTKNVVTAYIILLGAFLLLLLVELAWS